jgi:hypothetical protein
MKHIVYPEKGRGYAVYSANKNMDVGDVILTAAPGCQTLVIDGGNYKVNGGRLFIEVPHILVINSKLWASGGVFCIGQKAYLANAAVNIFVTLSKVTIIGGEVNIDLTIGTKQDMERIPNLYPNLNDAFAGFQTRELKAEVDYKTILRDEFEYNAPDALSAAAMEVAGDIVCSNSYE